MNIDMCNIRHPHIYECSSIYKDFSLLSWLNNNGFPWSSQTLKGAIKYGNNDVVELLLINRCPNDESVLKMAVEHGDIQKLEILDKYGYDRKYDNELLEVASRQGNHAVIRWLNTRVNRSESTHITEVNRVTLISLINLILISENHRLILLV